MQQGSIIEKKLFWGDYFTLDVCYERTRSWNEGGYLTKKLPTLLDNRDENTLLAALKRLIPSSKHLDVATGTFEIGSFLALEELWRTLEKIRIVMRDIAAQSMKKEIECLKTAK